MKHTYYYKDYHRIYWRIECTLDERQKQWDFTVFRSLMDHDDKKAQEVFHGSHEQEFDSIDKPNITKIINYLYEYYTLVTLGMMRNLSDLVDTAYIDPIKIIEKLQSENAKLLELLEIIRRYAQVEYAESASCRVIASEIQQVIPNQP